LYASVPSSDGPNGNSVAVIDPAAQKVLQYVPVGSEPHALAISDDGKVLWVVNTGSNTLRRVDLTTLTAGPLLPLGDTDYGKDGLHLSILPGTQDSVIVGSNGLTIYDNGVPRAMAATTYGLLTSATSSPWLAYGYNNNDTGYDFVTLCINQYGIFAHATQQNLLSGFGANLLFDAGILYGSNAAYDIGKQALIGSYPVADAVAIDPANRRIFTLRTFGTTQFVAYDMDTFAAIGNDPAFPSIQTEYPQLVRWGRYGIAFTNSTDFFEQPSLGIGKSVIVP
jgi:YVTN family beta-propeller protein